MKKAVLITRDTFMVRGSQKDRINLPRGTLVADFNDEMAMVLSPNGVGICGPFKMDEKSISGQVVLVPSLEEMADH